MPWPCQIRCGSWRTPRVPHRPDAAPVPCPSLRSLLPPALASSAPLLSGSDLSLEPDDPPITDRSQMRYTSHHEQGRPVVGRRPLLGRAFELVGVCLVAERGDA